MQHSEIVQFLRSQLKLTQKDFAEKFHLKQQQVLDIERGKTKISAETILLIIKELNLSVDWLLTGEGSMFRDEKKPPDNGNHNTIEDIVNILNTLPQKRRDKVLSYVEDQRDLSKLLNEILR